MGRPRIRTDEERRAVKHANYLRRYARNKSGILAGNAAYRHAHPEESRRMVREAMKRAREANPELARAKDRAKDARPARKRSSRKLHLQKRYGITLEQYATLLLEQGGACGICGRRDNLPNKHFAVDHCHKTGRVRGLLCSRCNSGLGSLGDELERVQKAIAYLRGA